MKKLSILPLVILVMASCGEKQPHPNILSENPQTDSFMQDKTVKIPANFDIQGHRGARALFPENTAFGMISALKIEGLTTLEMDVVVSKDKKVVLSHEPWMSSDICSFSNGDRVLPLDNEKYRLYEMTYDEICTFDCGKRWNKTFPKQKPKAQVKPLLESIFSDVVEYSAEQKIPDVMFNIEIKSKPEWDGFMTPEPKQFAQLVYNVIVKAGMQKRVTIQSFDPRALKAMREIDPSIPLVYLVENDREYKAKLAELDFKPAVYSPNYKLLDKAIVADLHAMGMKVIPWTVNDSIQMMKTIETGVDGIISDDPELLVRVAKLYR